MPTRWSIGSMPCSWLWNIWTFANIAVRRVPWSISRSWNSSGLTPVVCQCSWRQTLWSGRSSTGCNQSREISSPLSPRRWQRSSTTTNTCGMTLAPKQRWFPWNARVQGRKKAWAINPGWSHLRRQHHQGRRRGRGRERGPKLKSSKVSEEGSLEEWGQSEQRQEDPRLRVEVYLGCIHQGLGSEALPLLQLFDGMLYGG